MSRPRGIRDISGQRILLCNWRDAGHPQAGGSELYCLTVAERFARAGADVTYLTSQGPGQSRSDVWHGVKIVRRGGTYTLYVRALIWLLMHRRSLDMVLDCQNGIPFFSPLALSRKTTIVGLIHHVHRDQFGFFFSKPIAFVGRHLEGRASRAVYGKRAIVVVSPSTRAEVRRVLKRRGTIHVVPNGMETRALVSSVRAPDPTIAVVGRLVPYKRLNLLVEAMVVVREKFPRVRLQIMGAGPDRGRLESLAASLGLADCVTFYGRVSDEMRDATLSRAWLTVSPSAAEGWGLSVIEANAHGLPAVAFRVPGLRDAVREGETGWLIDRVEDLPSAIIRALTVLADPAEAQLWRERTRRWARKFSWDDTAERIASILLAERERVRRHVELGASHERRKASDLAVRIRVDQPGASFMGRRTDVIEETAQGTEGLLFGADEVDAVGALRSRCAANEFEVRVARPTDFLGTHLDRGVDE